MSPFKTIVLLTLCLGGGSPSLAGDSLEPPKAIIEIREAETTPSAELTEFVARGTKDKVYLAKEAALTTDDIARVRSSADANQNPALEVVFTREGARKMAALTGRRIGKPLAFLINGEVVGAPIVHAVVSSPCLISGAFTGLEIEAIVTSINGPPPPFPIWLVGGGLLVVSLLIVFVYWMMLSQNKTRSTDAVD